MSDEKYPNTFGVEIGASGDHRVHVFGFDRDISMVWDTDSQVVTLWIGESQAEDLYWWLLETVPQLRKDRR